MTSATIMTLACRKTRLEQSGRLHRPEGQVWRQAKRVSFGGESRSVKENRPKTTATACERNKFLAQTTTLINNKVTA